MLREYEGEEFTTSIGLPQDSVISPTLFNIYIKDMMANTTGNNCKFADDGTIWHTGPNMQDIKLNINGDIREYLTVPENGESMLVWTNLSSAFSPRRSQKVTKRYWWITTPSRKILGVTMDEKLTFASHINQVERKSSTGLKTIREIKGLARISRSSLLQIYNSLVRSIMEYACPV